MINLFSVFFFFCLSSAAGTTPGKIPIVGFGPDRLWAQTCLFILNNSKEPFFFYLVFCDVQHTLPLSLTSRDFPPSGSGIYETERQPCSGGGGTFYESTAIVTLNCGTPPPVMTLEHLDGRQHPDCQWAPERMAVDCITEPLGFTQFQISFIW